MNTQTLKLVLFVILLASPVFNRLLEKKGNLDTGVEEEVNGDDEVSEVAIDNLDNDSSKGTIIQTDKPSNLKNPKEAVSTKEAQQNPVSKAPEITPANTKPKEASQDDDNKPQQSPIGLYILIGVAVLGIVAIATTFVLGKAKN